MRTDIFALICMHMLLWAGCQSTPELHKARSIENFSTESTQINRLSWRKLLEENIAATANAKKEETMNASAIVEPKSVSEKNEVTSVPGKDDVQDVKKDMVDVKKEEGKTDPASLISEKEEEKGGGAGARDDAKKVEEPKGQGNQEAQIEEKPKSDELEQKDTRAVKEEKVEVLKIESNVHSQAVQIEEKTSTFANESATKEQEQADPTPDKVETSGESEPHDNPVTESSNSRENTDSKEELADVNPIKMVTTTSSDVKEMDAGDADKVVLTGQPEELVKDQIALENASAIEKKADNPNNSTHGSNKVTSNTGDGEAADEKVEDENELSAGLAIKKEKSEDGPEMVSQGESDEKVDEKRQGNDSDGDGDKQSESNDTERSEAKADENQDSSYVPNVGTKDDESEENDTKDISSVVKGDDETEAATKEVELQLEELKRGTVIEMAVEQAKERDLSEDEYDIIQELADLPTKFQETAGKVADHLRPDVIKWTDTSKVYFNRANQQITESFSPLLGKQYAPFFASMISYGILLLPLIVVILLFDHIKALFSLQKVLLFINIYLAAYFATLWLASFIIGLEPMSFFYVNSLSSYLSLQLLQGLGYVIYLILQTANIFHACSSDTLAGKITSTLQWIVAMAIGLHYYVTVFQPAIASKPPHTSWKFYAIYTAAFFVLCLFARIRWVKKQYVTSGSHITDKKS